MKNTIVRDFINKITHDVANLPQVVLQLKNSSTYSDLCNLTDDNSPFVKKFLPWFIGTPLPNKYSELGITPHTFQSLDFDIEL